MTAAAAHHRGDGLQQEIDVLTHAPVIDVLEVEVHPVLEGHLVPPADLPEAGEPRGDREPPALPGLVLRHLLRHRWTRADERHVAAEHVHQLGQLVDAVLAKDAPQRRHPGVTLHLEDRPQLLVLRSEGGLERLGVDHHRAELQHVELLPVQPHPQLAEEDGARRGELHQRRHHQEEGEQHPEGSRRARDVHQPLQHPLLGLDPVGHVMEESIGDGLAGHRLRSPEPHRIGRQGEGHAEGLAGPDRGLQRPVLEVREAAEVDLVEDLLLEDAGQLDRLADVPAPQRLGHLLAGPAQVAALGAATREVLAGDPAQRAGADDEMLARRARERTHVGEHGEAEATPARGAPASAGSARAAQEPGSSSPPTPSTVATERRFTSERTTSSQAARSAACA